MDHLRRLLFLFVVTLSLTSALGGSSTSGSGSDPSTGKSNSAASFIYSAGRGKTNKKDLSTFASPQSLSGSLGSLGVPSSSSSLLSTAYVEPRGDYGGGGYGGSGGGGYGGGGGGHGGGVYQYSIHPHGGGGGGGGWQPPAVYYQEDEGGLDKGLLGLLGLSGLKGLLGLAALLKLLLPLLLLLVPFLLPLLLAKAALLFALLLLIPIPVITPGRSLSAKEGDGSLTTTRALFQDTLTELLTKIPIDISHIIAKIKESELFKWKDNMTKVKSKDRARSKDKGMRAELRDNSVHDSRDSRDSRDLKVDEVAISNSTTTTISS